MLFQPATSTTAQVVEALNYGAMVTEAGTIALVWFLSLMVTAYKKAGDSFSFVVWLKGNINRFVVGIVLTIGIVVVNAVSTDVSDLLRVLGFTTEKTAISLGLAIAIFLVGGVASKPAEPPPPDEK